MTTPAITTVLVVDDDPFVRRGVADIFDPTSDIRVVADVDDGDQVLAAARTFRPHVVLMDLSMRRMGGLAAIEQLMTLDHPPRIIAMTALDVDDQVVSSVVAGAHSFLRKSEPPATFQLAVRAVAAGSTLFSDESLREIVRSEAGVQRIGARDISSRGVAGLSDREREVLGLVATGASNSAIAHRMFVGETTVKTHISSIFTKLDVTNRVEAALHAFRAGLVQ
ncbi:response regulator transcription factor [Williamsia sterculiae]|uniref:Two component transcriptional regulator, LuxR family n=1 Tax=Williamsia sterculiae TaxID=1344003 RepID=A0A1N7FYI2_9NOCA|nr:response regulator transcription factor [Williamsia sterculiae]SIS05337.1 two component transcriptional regulator, LuxR family [Williamsia sterculiae]